MERRPTWFLRRIVIIVFFRRGARQESLFHGARVSRFEVQYERMKTVCGWTSFTTQLPWSTVGPQAEQYNRFKAFVTRGELSKFFCKNLLQPVLPLIYSSLRLALSGTDSITCGTDN
jgi:hypothetical protein